MKNKKFNILIDITPLQGVSNFRGVGRVVFEFVSETLSQNFILKKYNIYLLKFENQPTCFDNLTNIITINKKFPRISLTKKLRKNKIDLYQSMESLVPIKFLTKSLSIAFIHDLIPLIFKKEHFKIRASKEILINNHIKNKYINKLAIFLKFLIPIKFINFIYINYQNIIYKFKLKKIIQNSNYFICNSKYTKDDFIKFFPEYSQKTFYTLLGFKPQNKVIEPQQKDYLSKLNLSPKKYFYYIGGFDFRKNLDGLIDIFKIFSLNPKYSDFKLVIIGKSGNKVKERLREYANQLNINNNVIFTGYLKDEEAEIIIQNSICFLFPSLYEGFGLPILEAMHFNKPVITFNNSSIPEISGNAALLVTNKNNSDFAKAMGTIIENKILYNNYVIRGKNHIKKFSWKIMVKQTIEIYDSLLYK